MKHVGMVLEGGGQRGVFTSGVLDYLMEQNFKVPYVIGVSAGACNAVDYVSGQIGRTKKCMIDALETHQYMTVKSLIKNGYLFDMDLVFDQFPNELYPFDFDAFFKSDIQCLMAATDCLTGKVVYLEDKTNRKRMMDACRASSSLPFVSPMVMVDGIPMLDGGLADSIPIKRAVADGYHHNIIILTKVPGYRKPDGPGKTVKLARAFYKKYPNLVKALEERNKKYNRTLAAIERLEQKGQAFVFRPEFDGAGRAEKDLKKLNRLYQHGYDTARVQYDRLQQWLAQLPESPSKEN